MRRAESRSIIKHQAAHRPGQTGIHNPSAVERSPSARPSLPSGIVRRARAVGVSYIAGTASQRDVTGWALLCFSGWPVGLRLLDVSYCGLIHVADGDDSVLIEVRVVRESALVKGARIVSVDGDNERPSIKAGQQG